MNDRAQREFKMHRMSGMAQDTRQKIAKQLETAEWWVRCWNCRENVTVTPAQLAETNCSHCGVRLAQRG